jgi:hypothetical protein
MINPSDYSFCGEFDFVEKAIEIVVRIGEESKRIRIEALKDSAGKYRTREYVEDHVTLQSAFGDEAKQTTIWVPYDLPWTHGHSADEVLKRALSFLEERCR